MTQSTTVPLHPVCRHCGSDQIVRDASARWDAAAQAWTLSGVYDCHFCDTCNREGDTLAQWTTATGEEPEGAGSGPVPLP
ncbi:hypothetical protein L6Q21_09780 [Sandaracinobacter sp. RS1-74]|uniref:hypothetical protein n=1 Tax=Sandaracinobacteroides sayramensis TaxID=2913411 RepID=UPI001ED9E0F1|nr:hypothetical protein [Sandaracinobacteroides sayramensis]MCG2841269.1 hypothetical protein [Sandaracinobacteroides sayramensis]